MKSIVSRITVLLVVGALSGVVALAKVHKDRITFDTDTKVNDTLVKKGTYQVRFDEESGELKILKNGKVVAEAMAKLEQRDKKATTFRMRSTSGDVAQLLGVTFDGEDKEAVLTNGAAQSTGNN